MPDLANQVATVTNRFRRLMAQEERASSAQLQRAYGRLWQESKERIRRLIKQIKESGHTLNVAQIRQLMTWRILEAELRQRLDSLSQQTAVDIATLQTVAVDLGTRYAQAATQEQDEEAVLIPLVNTQPYIGRLPNGDPNIDLIEADNEGVIERLLAAIALGIALGWSQTRIIDEIRSKAFGQNLSHVLRVNRTESNRSYRQVIQQLYIVNDDRVGGWYWISKADSRTCASCWAMHGTYHRLNETLDDHPNGRCIPQPAVRGVNLNIPTGTQLFDALRATEQREILGNKKFEAFASGKITLSDLVHRSRSNVFGTMRREATLKQALRR